MKKNLLLILLGILTASCQEQNITTETFTVYGNCGMCKSTIEKSVKGVKGIKKGIWDLPTDQMTVDYDPDQISLDAIKQRIADVGYDSDTHRAKDEIYNNLPGSKNYLQKNF
jgi:copper chaperone CopZ